MQLQIRPHFYLNYLKCIYGMAEYGQYKEIQKTILLLSGYLRYIFSTTEAQVLFEEEVEQCRNYVKLFSVNQNMQAVLSLDYDVSFEKLQIPAVSLLTFVENSVKYAMHPEKRLEIWIGAKKIRTEGKILVNITIRDNGPGFDEEILKWLNQMEMVKDGKHKNHIGIYNVVQRFRMIYKETFAIGFFNDHGACIDLFFESKEEEL